MPPVRGYPNTRGVNNAPPRWRAPRSRRVGHWTAWCGWCRRDKTYVSRLTQDEVVRAHAAHKETCRRDKMGLLDLNTYTPLDGAVRLESDRILRIEDRRWPIAHLQPACCCKGGLADGWIAEIGMENGAFVCIMAERDHIIDPPARAPVTRHTMSFSATLHTMRRERVADGEAWAAFLANNTIVPAHAHDERTGVWYGGWDAHFDPEPWWLNEWLDRVARAEVLT